MGFVSSHPGAAYSWWGISKDYYDLSGSTVGAGNIGWQHGNI